MSDEKPIMMPSFCDEHRSKLIHGAKFKPHDPWMALEIASQLAMFQVILADNNFHIKYGGDAHAISRVGCMACFANKTFKQLIKVAKKNKDIGDIKKFGESFNVVKKDN